MAELRFDGRVAVITGAARGLGRAYARDLASRGAKVIVNDTGGALNGEGIDTAPAAEVVREIESFGGVAVACTESVATPQGGRAIIQSALEHYGRLDVLIHNAGIIRRAALEEMDYADFEAVLDVHLRGAFHVVRPAFPVMCNAGYGRVVLTSSINGLYGSNTKMANYCVAKAGVIALSHVVALEGAGRGVKSNVILPGAVTRMADGTDTSAFPPMDPDVVAPVITWLAHEACSISGEMLAAMAGRVARAFVAETPGVYRRMWSAEQVALDIDRIRKAERMVVFDVLPSGQRDHMLYSFEAARNGVS